MSWTIISPDLTRNDKAKQAASGGPITKDNTGVEVYDTIFSVVESPVQKDLIWAGTDDGLVHITRDGGQHWENVTPKAMPEWGTVSMIEASPTRSRHRLHRRRTPQDGRLRSLHLQDHRLRQDLDQAGRTAFPPTTTFTPFASIPRVRACSSPEPSRASTSPSTTARNWQSLQLNLPMSPVNDLDQSRTTTWSSRRTVAASGCSTTSLHCGNTTIRFRSRTRTCSRRRPPTTRSLAVRSLARGGNVGKNPPAGAVIDYWLKTFAEETGRKARKQPAATPSKLTASRKEPMPTRKANPGRTRSLRRSRSRFSIPPAKSSASFPRRKKRTTEPSEEEDFRSRAAAAWPISPPMPA